MQIDTKPLKQQETAVEMNKCCYFPAEKSSKIWRPWDEDTAKAEPKTPSRFHPYKRCHMSAQSTNPFHSYMNTFKHPVRLYWTKAAYDYMYEAGEKLLRNFPVQATIQVVEESDSEDSEDEDDEDDEDDENTLVESSKETPKDNKKSNS